jgi:hypothetical protein
MKPYQILAKYWQDSRADISAGPTDPADVEALERKYGVRLTEDFREYSLHAAPL